MDIMTKRLYQVQESCERTGVHMVYTQLSTKWVDDSARWEISEGLENDLPLSGRW